MLIVKTLILTAFEFFEFFSVFCSFLRDICFLFLSCLLLNCRIKSIKLTSQNIHVWVKDKILIVFNFLCYYLKYFNFQKKKQFLKDQIRNLLDQKLITNNLSVNASVVKKIAEFIDLLLFAKFCHIFCFQNSLAAFDSIDTGERQQIFHFGPFLRLLIFFFLFFFKDLQGYHD